MIAIWHEEDGTVEIAPSAAGRGGVVVADPAPADWQTVDYTVVDGVLVVALDYLKAKQRLLIQKARDRAMMDNVVVPDMPDPGDAAEFQLRASTPAGKDGYDFISGFVLEAKDALRWEEPYSEPFKLADNRNLFFDAEQWVAIGAGIKATMRARFVRGEMILGLLEFADTPEAIAAITWDMDLPE